MKIKQISVVFTWEDGSTHEVSSYLPMGIWEELETFSDYWEEEYGNEEKTEEDA